MAHRVRLGRDSRWTKGSLSLGLGERKKMEKGSGRGKMKIEQEKWSMVVKTRASDFLGSLGKWLRYHTPKAASPNSSLSQRTINRSHMPQQEFPCHNFKIPQAAEKTLHAPTETRHRQKRPGPLKTDRPGFRYEFCFFWDFSFSFLPPFFFLSLVFNNFIEL